ncbi:MAG: NAD(P)-dependent alcohol dehydrogenase, partial [Lewinella sp.]|nr:NAD(P)-dependent alcohol dehydrogenase [Lewinella sp.]
MKAAIRHQYGPPEVLTVAEVDRPVAGEQELLIRVHATTVSRTDCGLLWAKPFVLRFFTGLRRPRLRTPGSDFA